MNSGGCGKRRIIEKRRLLTSMTFREFTERRRSRSERPNTGVLKMQVQRKNENGVESNCLLLILLMILNFFGVLLEIKLLKRGKLLNFEFIKVSWLTMEKCLSDELNNKMTNLKSSISEHAIEQVLKKTRRLCLVRVFQGGRNARQLEPTIILVQVNVT